MKVGAVLRNAARTLKFSPAIHLDLAIESFPREPIVENAKDALTELQKMTVDQEHVYHCVSELLRVVDHFQDGLIDWRPRGRVEEFKEVSFCLSLACMDVKISPGDEEDPNSLASAIARGESCLATVSQLQCIVSELKRATKLVYWENPEEAMYHYNIALHSLYVVEQIESWFMTQKGVYSDYDESD